jgi:hypothetical protein
MLGQKGHYEFCNSSTVTGIGYKYLNESAVFCFSRWIAFAGEKAFAHCPSGYNINGASKAVCQEYGSWVQQPAEEPWPTCKLKVNDAEGHNKGTGSS